MALCRDKAISELNRLGYDMVRFPRPDIRPLDVIVESSNSFSRLSPLPNMWESNAAVPEISQLNAPSISNVESAEMKASIAASAMADIFQVNLGAAARAAKSVHFVAITPLIMTCDRAALERYVSQGDPRSDAVAARYFIDETVRVYVITEVIASKQLQIIVGGQNDLQAKAAAADISKAIKAQVDVGSTSSAENVITYQRNDPATFGFKSAEIYFDAAWLLDLPRKPGAAFLGRREQAVSLLAPNTRLSFTDIES